MAKLVTWMYQICSDSVCLVLTLTLCLTMETNCLAYGNGNVAVRMQGYLFASWAHCQLLVRRVFSSRFCIIQQCHSVYLTASALSSVLMYNWSQRITVHWGWVVPQYDCTSVMLQFINQSVFCRLCGCLVFARLLQRGKFGTHVCFAVRHPVCVLCFGSVLRIEHRASCNCRAINTV